MDRMEEDVVWSGVTVNVLMHDKLIMEKDRKTKKLKKAHARRLNGIA